MAPGLFLQLLFGRDLTKSGSPAFKAPSAMAWSVPQDTMCSGARSPAVSAMARVAVPEPSSLGSVAAHLSRLVQEDALRHEWVGAALRYQRDFRAHASAACVLGR